MPATTTARIAPDVKRLLDAGQVSRVDEASGVLRTLHANCPRDGERASVRRMSRELGGAIMDITMRCPACFNDFTATPESLYLSGRLSRPSSATKAPAPSAAKAPAKTAAKAPTKSAAKAPAKQATKAPAKSAPKTAAKSTAKTPAAKSAAKTPAKSASKAGAKSTAKSAKKAPAKSAPKTRAR